MKFKLAVGDVLEYDVKFTMRDGKKDRTFGLRLKADRADGEVLSSDDVGESTIGEFLKARNVTMLAWIGEPPLVDEATNEQPAVGPEALEGVLDMVPGAPGLIYMGYVEANSAKGRRGN